MSKTDDLVARWRAVGPVAWAESPYGWIGDDGRPIVLADWQRAALDAWWAHRADVTTFAVSNVKKSGKTTLNAVLLCWRWLALPGLHFACGNDLDQSQARQFAMVADMCQHNAYLRQNVKTTRSELTFTPTGSRLVALANDASGNAGANHLTASHTEAWGIVYEAGVRAWEELTPPPGLVYGFPALRIADSYAGHLSESETWHALVDRALSGEFVSESWPVYKAGGLLAFHITGDEAQARCFRGTEAERMAYYAEQRASLREGTYRRLHLNERTAAESVFVDPSMWDALILDGYHCPAPGERLHLVAGLDIGVKNDYAACVTVYHNRQVRDGLLYLGPYRIWRPSPVVDLGAVEDYVIQLSRGYGLVGVWADPWQAAGMIQRLRGKVNVHEYPQTVPNLTEAGNTLFDTIRQGHLVVYAGATDLRQHVLAAHAKETERGIRLVKGSTRKIDAAIAMAMAVVSCIRYGRNRGARGT